MNTLLFDRITIIADRLLTNGEKLTTDKIIVASLFSVGGTLAEYKKEVEQVVKMYTKGINEFTYTYKHNGKTETFTLNINSHGVMCLGFKTSDGKKYYQCAMDRHIDEQMQLIMVLSKTSKDDLMQYTFIPNNISYLNKAVDKLSQNS